MTIWISLIAPSSNLIFHCFSLFADSPVKIGRGSLWAVTSSVRLCPTVSWKHHRPCAEGCGSKEASCVDPTDCNAEQLGGRQQWGGMPSRVGDCKGNTCSFSADTKPSRPIPKAFLISSGVGFGSSSVGVDVDMLGSLAEGARVRGCEASNDSRKTKIIIMAH